MHEGNTIFNVIRRNGTDDGDCSGLYFPNSEFDVYLYWLLQHKDVNGFPYTFGEWMVVQHDICNTHMSRLSVFIVWICLVPINNECRAPKFNDTAYLNHWKASWKLCAPQTMCVRKIITSNKDLKRFYFRRVYFCLFTVKVKL